METKDTITSLPYYNDATFTPHWLQAEDTELDSFHRIPSFSLFNQDGELITESTFENHIYITDFFFTECPGICPAMTKNMAALQDTFLNIAEVLFLSHSVTPAADSIAALKAYAVEKGVISGKWHLVTGDRTALYALGRAAYFVEEDLGMDKELDDFLHTENFVLIDKGRHIRGIYNGLNKSSLDQLVKDVKVLLNES